MPKKAAKKTTDKKVTKKTTKTVSAKLTKPVEAVASKKVTKKAKAKPAHDVSQVPSPEKQEIIAQFAVKSGDTGSPEVQVALLTKRIEKLVGHLKGNPHDNHSRRGLLGIVSKRRRLLNYLEKKDVKRVKAIKVKLGLT